MPRKKRRKPYPRLYITARNERDKVVIDKVKELATLDRRTPGQQALGMLEGELYRIAIVKNGKNSNGQSRS